MRHLSCFEITSNELLAKDVYRMILSGDTSHIANAGQFVNIQLDELFLRRPISVCDVSDGALTIIYKVVGKGTEVMSKLPVGKTLNVLSGLGNGYDIEACGDRPVLIGGGVGVPPLYLLAKRLSGRCKVVIGFNSAEEVFYEEEFKALGADVTVTTVDGSCGVKGFVTDALDGEYSHYYACGPLPMLKAVYNKLGLDGEMSLEERMGCGFGACMGCTIKTKSGFKRVCREGPVFKAEDLIW